MVENWELDMRENQCLDTDLNRIRDFARTRSRISVRISTLLAITSAASELSDDGAPVICSVLLRHAFFTIMVPCIFWASI